MSKKSKRAKHIRRRMVQPAVQTLQQLISYAQHQMVQSNFAEAITTCESLQQVVPQKSAMHVEVLSLLGLSHAVLNHYQESYEIFTKALTIEPSNAELWYNRGLAAQCLTRVGQSVRDFERAVELAGNDTGEMARQFANELAKSRQDVADAMQVYGEQIPLNQYIEREDFFIRAMQLMKQSQWMKAEQVLQQLVEMGGPLPQYWGNLGVCLVMQSRYDDAEAALKRALAIDPRYPIARDNLKKLPKLRRGGPATVDVVNLAPIPDVEQTITFFEKSDDQLSTIFSTKVETSENLTTSTRKQFGQLSPRHSFFLNPYKNNRFTTCPKCGAKTLQRKYTLVIHVDPKETLLWDKLCRYCHHCDLLIAHQGKLEELLVMYFTQNNPEIIGNDYQVLGTLERSEGKRALSEKLYLHEIFLYLHDFLEIVSFQQLPV